MRIKPRLGGVWYGNGFPFYVIVSEPLQGSFIAWVELTYPMLSGNPRADYDYDGIDDGTEFAFGMDPTDSSDASQFPKPTATSNSITFEFNAPAGIQGVYYWGEVSTNLVDWMQIADQGSNNLHRFVRNFGDYGPCDFCGFA